MIKLTTHGGPIWLATWQLVALTPLKDADGPCNVHMADGQMWSVGENAEHIARLCGARGRR